MLIRLYTYTVASNSTVQIINSQYTFNAYHAIHLHRQPYKNASAETVSMDLKSELKKVFTGQVRIYTTVGCAVESAIVVYATSINLENYAPV